ncbi:unnamed protein product [Pleuronectes platessa]|uniref:Uncharacterized protein n=1 Tax=Pleuronectes platessa TaxID=8262 RepID=A0A9N7Z9Y7_PLEPL|nr:unnamed protein product [Pleuronectes platessa]
MVQVLEVTGVDPPRARGHLSGCHCFDPQMLNVHLIVLGPITDGAPRQRRGVFAQQSDGILLKRHKYSVQRKEFINATTLPCNISRFPHSKHWASSDAFQAARPFRQDKGWEKLWDSGPSALIR